VENALLIFFGQRDDVAIDLPLQSAHKRLPSALPPHRTHQLFEILLRQLNPH
jgi:hypothetical protein